jgi:tetratricopeptide (TPR) repeat protein
LRTKAIALAFVLLIADRRSLIAQNRIASDFEIQQMERQVAQQRDFLAQLSARLNLGDLRLTRNEVSLARAEYARALDVATKGRSGARRDSDYTRYAAATAYAGLAQAKLGAKGEAFALLEEALRYASDDAKTWNLYATAMSLLRAPRKAASAARNAVAIGGEPLDAAVYRYTLASALIESGEQSEAEQLLARIVSDLRSPAFDELRQRVASKEQFEIYSTARGDEAAYLSLLNRAQLRLGALYEARGDTSKARKAYEGVLEARSDDATALAALARLSKGDDRDRYFAEAFDANPFSPGLIAEYRRTPHAAPQGDSVGARVRTAVDQMARKEHRAARETLEALRAKFPENETLRSLLAENERAMQGEIATNELRALLLTWDAMTPEQRAALDQRTFTYVVTFETAGSVFESGIVDDVPFRFSEPTAFNGTFGPKARLTFRILGVTKQNGADALLLEPLRLEALP